MTIISVGTRQRAWVNVNVAITFVEFFWACWVAATRGWCPVAHSRIIPSRPSFRHKTMQWLRSLCFPAVGLCPGRLPASCLCSWQLENGTHLKHPRSQPLVHYQRSIAAQLLPVSFRDIGGLWPLSVERTSVRGFGDNALLSGKLWLSSCEMSVGSVVKKRRSKMNKHKYKKRARRNRFKTKQ